MRALGFSLVILSLCFSAGGVAWRSHADPAPAASALAVDGAAPSQCRVSQPGGSQRVIELPDRSVEKTRFVPLNGQGYNYGDADVWRPPIANGHVPPSAGVPAAPAKP